MQLWLRLTVLGICAAAGLSFAVAVAVPAANKSLAKNSSSQSRNEPAAQPAAEPISVSPAIASPTISNAPPPTIDQTRELIDEVFHRWTATHWPPMTRQFEMLQQAQDNAKKFQETGEALAEQNVKLQNELRQQKEELPPANQPLPALPPAAAEPDPQTPEILVDTQRELVSINALSSDIREVLRSFSDAAGINILSTPSVNGTVSLSLNQVDVETALAAILKSSGFSSRREGKFLYVGTVEDLQKMSVAGDNVGTRVYRPNYVTAAELQKLIASMLSPEVGMVSVSTAADVGIASSKDQAGGDTYAGSDVLVVRDFESVLVRIDELYEEIDRMPSQVIIEAMILSVRLDDQDTLGVNFELLRNQDNIRLVSGGTANSLANLNFTDGLKIGFLDESLFVFVNALETIGDTNVIASPRVMCLNKQRAEILIGSELGYVSTTVTETASTQAVEFLEVGTHLKIRPFISNDGMVRLEVHPELSTGTVRVQGGFTLPDKDVTQVTTNVMCRSGATVVIGGLIREDLVTTSQQIPVLGNLPLVGAVFRSRTEDTERREIIVLLTPRIVEEADQLAEGQHAATQARDRRNAFFDKMQPWNKRRIADRYGRLALSAWAAGDADMALRYANLAIHYDPLHQDAIDLRQEVLAAYPAMENGVHGHMKYGLVPTQHPVHDYSAQTGWPWRDAGPVPQKVTGPPADGGSPGPVRHLITDR
jgi:type IV pilus assembly protein PilQ